MNTILNDEQIDFTQEPLFLGSGRNIIRLDLNIEQWIKNHTERLLGNTWFSWDFNYSQDAKDFDAMQANLQELFLKNLKFQQFLDSLAVRTVTEVFKPITTNPQLESYWTIHGFQEDIHHQSYADLIKTLPVNANKIFDDIMINPEILKRGKDISDRFNHTALMNNQLGCNHPDYSEEEHKKSLILSLFALNILENGLFQTSFITTFAFAENGMMESSAKSMGRISKDEDTHAAMTVHILNRLRKDKKWRYIFKDNENTIINMYKNAYEADLIWIDYLFEDGAKLLGLNANILKEYSKYITYKATHAIGLDNVVEDTKSNPCSWANKYSKTANTQTALKEADGTNYKLGSLNKRITEDDWQSMKTTGENQ